MRLLILSLMLLCFGCDNDPGPTYERDAFVNAIDMSVDRDEGPENALDRGTDSPDAMPEDGSVNDAATPADAAAIGDSAAIGDAAPSPEDQGPPPERPALESVAWPLRSCAQRIAYCQRPETQVRLAGEFTCNGAGQCWADGARRLTPSDEPCSATGAVWHEIVLDGDDGLMPEVTYGYKLIIGEGDGERWVIDESAQYRKMENGCLNSGVRLPACSAGPAVSVVSLASPDVTQRDVVIQVHQSADERGIASIDLRLNGQPVDAYRLTLTGELSVRFDALPSGKHRISIRATDGDGRESSEVIVPFWVEERPFDWRDGPLYLLFIDRFANGDADNDRPLGDLNPAVEWHGGDLQGALAALESGYFESLGVRTIWLSPVNTQVDAAMSARESDHLIAPYHGYWPVRGRDVEPRFGGNEALSAFVEGAHARGIRVLLDLINNQVHEDHEYVAENPEWFRRGCVCGIGPGCGWSERPFDCLFAGYLPDIDWTNPGAEAQFIDDALYWIDEFDIDGFRVDAVKHVEPMAIYNLRAALDERFAAAGERIIMLGETAVSAGDRYNGMCGVDYGDGYAWIEGYTGVNALDGQFDFPTYHRVAGFLQGGGSLRDVENALADSESRFSSDAIHVQFLGSHDTARLISRAAQDRAVGCRFADLCGDPLPGTVQDPGPYARIRLAWTLLYTTRTLPLLYYGDEMALAGANDPDNRRDLPWDDAVGGTPSSGLDALQLSHFEFMQALGQLRAAHPALQRGDRVTLRVDDNLLVYRRQTEDATAFVLLNTGEATDVLLEYGAPDTLSSLLGTASLDVTPTGVRVQLGTNEVAIIGTSTP